MAFADSSGPQLPRITCIRPNHEVRRDHATHKHHALQPIHEADQADNALDRAMWEDYRVFKTVGTIQE